MSDQRGDPTEGLLAALRADLGAAACSVALVDGSELVFVAAVGEGADQIVGMRIPLDRGIAGWAVVSGQPIAVADVHRDRRFDKATAQSTGYLPTTILAVPLDGEDAAIGVLEVLDRAPTVDDLDRAARVAAELVAFHTSAAGDPGGPGPTTAELAALVDRLASRPATVRTEAYRRLTALLAEPVEGLERR